LTVKAGSGFGLKRSNTINKEGKDELTSLKSARVKDTGKAKLDINTDASNSYAVAKAITNQKAVTKRGSLRSDNM